MVNNFEISVNYILNKTFFHAQISHIGITAKKAVFRLLNEYSCDTNLINDVIAPFWEDNPHQDVRVCLIIILLNFISKINFDDGNDDNADVAWDILKQAAKDSYLPVVQSLFEISRGTGRWPLYQLKVSSENIYKKFVNEIQTAILDPPSSLEARSYAWRYIDNDALDTDLLVGKAKEIITKFDKSSNVLWEITFDKILFLCKQNET